MEGSKVVPAFSSLHPKFCIISHVRLQFHVGEYEDSIIFCDATSRKLCIVHSTHY